jgi:hypothetical protein
MHFFYDAGSSGGVPSHIQHLVSRIQYSDATNACSVRDLRTRCARGNAMPPANQQPSTRRHRQGQLGKGKSVQLIGQRLLFHSTHEIDESEVGLVVGCLVELQGGLAFLGDICRGRLGRQCQRVLACERAGEGAVFWRTCCEPPSGAVNINPETLQVRIKASLNALLERGRIQGGRVDAAKIGAGNSVENDAQTEIALERVRLKRVMTCPKEGEGALFSPVHHFEKTKQQRSSG